MILFDSNFIRLSSDQFPESDRLEATRELYGRAIMKVDFEPLPDAPFHLDAILRALPGCGLSFATYSPIACVRTPSLRDSDDLVLTVALSGGGILRGRGKEAEIGGGHAVLSSSEDTGCLYLPSRGETINVRLTFGRIAPLIADLDAALVRPIPENMEAMRLLLNYVGALKHKDTLATPELLDLVVTHLHDLAALAIGATRDAAAVAGVRGVRAARLRAIKADIIDNLRHPDLPIAAIAARHGITPRYVRMLFEGEGMSFSEFVLGQRLTRAYRMLTDPCQRHRTISTIAFEVGFGDLSYFNRSFRRRFGATPSDVRAGAPRENGR